MSETATVPRTFKEVPGWRESFTQAAERLDNVRTGSLFDLPATICGERVRAFTLADWTVLDQADNPFVSGGLRTVAHASNIIWLLSPGFRMNSRWARFKRGLIIHRIMRRANCDEMGIIDEVNTFIDDSFLDMPGRFSSSSDGGRSVVNWPRKAMEIELCGEVMAQFPAMHYDDLRTMPLARFWQWLHDARARKYPEYRNYQLTDSVNTWANGEVNRLRKEAEQNGTK